MLHDNDVPTAQVEVLARWLRSRELTVSAIYVSNVPEYYSGRERRDLFDGLRRLPLKDDSVILMTRRSGFDLYPKIRSLDEIGSWRGRGLVLSLAVFGALLVTLVIRKRKRI